MRLFLTGATGFVGAHLLDRLVKDERHQLAVLIRDPSRAWRVRNLLDRVKVIPGDLVNLHPARVAIEDFGPEGVVHIAWDGAGRSRRNDAAQFDNARVTAELVGIGRLVGIRHWVGIGSQAEYGPSDGPINEDAPARPATLYGIAKLAAGLAAGQMCREANIRFAWLRLFSAYGPMDDPAYMVPTVTRQLLAGEKPSLTAGTQEWDYLYVEDVARAIQAVIECPSAEGVFNVGSGRPQTIRSVVEQIRDLIDPRLPLGFGEAVATSGRVMHLEADVRRLKSAVAWSPAVDLPAGLARTIRWFREQGACRPG